MQKTKKTNLKKEFPHVGLFIEDYEYIFSDFDSRPYSHKLLSEDLLDEMNRVTKDRKEDEILVRFIVPKNKRNPNIEKIIKNRIKEYFKKHFIFTQIEKNKIIKEGLLFFFFGILFMVGATFFIAKNLKNYLLTFLSVLFEPAGWFLFWEGLNLIIFDSKKKFPKLNFYKKMSKAKITFSGV